MKNNKIKNIQIGVLFGLICAITLSFAGFDAKAQDLRQNILRLHIVANSDSVSDQTLKLKVRDAILEECGEYFVGCDNLSDAIIKAQNNISKIQAVAQRTIEQNGFDYKANVDICDSYFSTRIYDDFTLPAGVYKALKVELGKADGQNWWCVVFPSVCVPAATKARLSDAVSSSSAEIAEGVNKYVFRFKTVEIYEDIKQKISNR